MCDVIQREAKSLWYYNGPFRDFDLRMRVQPPLLKDAGGHAGPNSGQIAVDIRWPLRNS